jgi:hypothetical protein
MDEPLHPHLHRLQELERRCARLRIWCATLTMAALTACLTSALRPRSDIVEARGFVVVGPDGAPRARLGGEDPLSSRGLVLYGPRGDKLAFFSAIEKGESPHGPTPPAVVLQMESDSDSDPNVFTAMVTDDRAGFWVTNDRRSIESWIEPDRSRLCFTESTRGVEPVDSGEKNQPRLKIEVAGADTSIQGLNSTGTVVFRQP